MSTTIKMYDKYKKSQSYFPDTRQDLIFPPLAKAYDFQNITIHCKSKTKPWWKFSGAELPDNAKDLGSGVLLLQKISLKNFGVYECFGMTPFNSTSSKSFPFYAYAELKIYSKIIKCKGTLKSVKKLGADKLKNMFFFVLFFKFMYTKW